MGRRVLWDGAQDITIEELRLNRVRPLADADKPRLAEVLTASWGSTRMASQGHTYDLLDIPGFIAESDGEWLGYAAYVPRGIEFEIAMLESLVTGQGAGSALLASCASAAIAARAQRLWLITTNDNVDALRFYQLRGFVLVAVHRDAVTHARATRQAGAAPPGLPRHPAPGRDRAGAAARRLAGFCRALRMAQLIIRGGTVVTAARRFDRGRRGQRRFDHGRGGGTARATPMRARSTPAACWFCPASSTSTPTRGWRSEDEPDRFFQDSVAAAFGGTTTFLSFNNPGTGARADWRRCRPTSQRGGGRQTPTRPWTTA